MKCLLTISYRLYNVQRRKLIYSFMVVMFTFSEQEGGTPLYFASQNGHSATVDVLLTCGADPNIARNVSQFFKYSQGYKDCCSMRGCTPFIYILLR